MGASNAQTFTIHDAINQAIQTHPAIGEATANRRATEAELRQRQGSLLPQVRLEASTGPEQYKRHITPVPIDNGATINGSNASIVVRQVLFDGFSSLNEIWRQAARVDGAALRVLERSELIALDAVEAYIDVTRYLRLVRLSEENFGAHNRILSNVRQRFEGGRSGEGDLQQSLERVAATEAVLADFRRSLEDARAKYRRAVGLEPANLVFPARLSRMPASKDESLAIALRFNPTIQAAQADADAAKFGFRATSGAFMPTVSLEGRALRGNDSDQVAGRRDDVSGKVIMSWDIFRGGQDVWRRNEAAERMIEQGSRHARLQREAFEALDKAWAARTITNTRIAALTREVNAAGKVVTAYSREYQLGQRTLIDLLNAQNQQFNAMVSLVSSRGVTVFADYQLLAAMGKLLDYLKTAPAPEAELLETRPFGLFPLKIPHVWITEPVTGPEPLTVDGRYPVAARAHWASAASTLRIAGVDPKVAAAAIPEPQTNDIDARWPQSATSFAPTNPMRIVSWPIGKLQ